MLHFLFIVYTIFIYRTASLLTILLSAGTSRPLNISIFNEKTTQIMLAQQITEDSMQSTAVTKLLHNKFTSYLYTLLENYYAHFTGSYLFVKGGFPTRYSTASTGLLYPIEAIFLIVGLSFLLVKTLTQKNNLFFVPIVWLLLGPIPVALTFEDIPNVQRSIMMLPSFIFFTIRLNHHTIKNWVLHETKIRWYF